MGHTTSPRQRVLFAVFLLSLFPAGSALQPKMDEDTWWHLAVGRYVVQNRDVPTEDPFSRIGQEEHVPWVAYSWLHEVALYAAYELAGLSGILAFRHFLDSLTFLTLAWFILSGSGGLTKLLAVLALVTATIVPMMLERPWHYTIIFTTLTLHATIAMHAGATARRYWWLIPLYALWANLHIQFVLGLGLLGLGLSTTLLSRWHSSPTGGSWKEWLLLSIGCAAATLVNPYHGRVYQVVWEYATQTGALLVVAELAAPDYTMWWNWALIALLAWAGVACAFRRLPLLETALLVAGAFFSLRMQRDIWFGALTAAAALTRWRSRPQPATERVSLTGMFAVTLLAVILLRAVWAVGPGRERVAIEVNRQKYPAAAVDYVREHRPPGPLYNHFNWGGYLIWALPEYAVGLDGRTNLYGEERLLRAFRTWNGEDGWDQDPDLFAAGVVIAPKMLGKSEIALTGLMQAARDRWRVDYEDDVSVVFVPVK